MKTIRKTWIMTLVLSLVIGFHGLDALANLDSDNATVRLEVAKFAKIQDLDDFVLTPIGSDGDDGDIYSGFDMFRVRSNTPVLVSLQGGQLSNGVDSIQTSYALELLSE